MRFQRVWLLAILAVFSEGAEAAEQAPRIRVLIVDGFSNHDWQLTTRSIRAILEPTGLFSVAVSTSPPRRYRSRMGPMAAELRRLRRRDPDLQRHQRRTLVAPTRARGFREVHTPGWRGLYMAFRQHAFPDWPAYNDIIGIGWRKKDFGFALVVADDGTITRIPPGQGEDTGHGKRFDALVRRRGEHPIHQGLPLAWLAADIEVYYHVRGPAKKVAVLSYAREPHTSLNWPIEWTVRYGRGRVYTSTLGHVWRGDVQPVTVRDAAVQTLLVRALQWLSRRAVTWPVPADFPTLTSTSIRGELHLPD